MICKPEQINKTLSAQEWTKIIQLRNFQNVIKVNGARRGAIIVLHCSFKMWNNLLWWDNLTWGSGVMVVCCACVCGCMDVCLSVSEMHTTTASRLIPLLPSQLIIMIILYWRVNLQAYLFLTNILRFLHIIWTNLYINVCLINVLWFPSLFFSYNT